MLISSWLTMVNTGIYIPSIQIKRKLKNGSISVKPKPLFPGCIFLKCLMDKEMHDFIRECDGVGGFVGSRVGNTKRQIHKPRPVSEDDMETIFRQVKEEQVKADQASIEDQKGEEIFDPAKMNIVYTDTTLNSEFMESIIDQGPKSRTKFSGLVKKVSCKTGKATVGFTLFGKETMVDLDVSEIAVET